MPEVSQLLVGWRRSGGGRLGCPTCLVSPLAVSLPSVVAAPRECSQTSTSARESKGRRQEKEKRKGLGARRSGARTERPTLSEREKE